jgi:transposase
MEDHLFNESNKVLEKLGIRLNFITLTFDLDEQTRQSIDVATAMKIYQSKNLEDIGKMIMVAKAGATKISITEEAQKPEEKK